MKEYDERIIAAFLTNYRAVDIIRETGLSKTTVYKYRNNPEFQKIIRERKKAIVETAVNKMQGYLLKNIDALQEIIESPGTSAQVKVYAVQTMFNQLREWMTTAEIIDRIAELEKAMEKQQR